MDGIDIPRLVHGAVKRYRRIARAAGAEWEDLVQSGHVAALESDRAYRPGETSRRTFIWMCVCRAVRREITRHAHRGFTWVGGTSAASKSYGKWPAPPLSLDARVGRRAKATSAKWLPDRKAGRVYFTPDQWDQVLAALSRPERAVVRRKYRDGTGTKRGWDMGRLTARQSTARQQSAFATLRTHPCLADYRPDA